MNIFASSPSPEKSAKALDNKRLVKMVLETCQLLSTAITECGGTGPYKTTHKNHPCSVWTRQSKSNYQWLLNHFYSLSSEYSCRYNRQHKCASYFGVLLNGLQVIPDGPLTTHPNCTIYKDILDVHEAYTKYLKYKWSLDKSPSWTTKYTQAYLDLTLNTEQTSGASVPE